MKTKWIKTLIWNGIQTAWSIDAEPQPRVSIERDRRASMDAGEYPYCLHVRGEYRGHYRRLSDAKRDAVSMLGEGV